MMPQFARQALYVVLTIVVSYSLLRIGEYVTTGLTPDSLTINAFLFLMGLGSALTLLSPIHNRHHRRVRW
jgi:hypothetical protein